VIVPPLPGGWATEATGCAGYLVCTTGTLAIELTTAPSSKAG